MSANPSLGGSTNTKLGIARGRQHGLSRLHVRRRNYSGNGLLRLLIYQVLRDLSELTMKLFPCLIAKIALMIHGNVNGKIVQSGSKNCDWANDTCLSIDSLV